MRAARLHAIGGPDHVRVERVDAPQPGPGEALVRVDAAALNRRDLFITQGLYPGIALPVILGSDAVGTVIAYGPGANGPELGARVVIDPMLEWGDDPRVWSPAATILGMPRPGTLAEYVCVPAVNVHAAPPHLTRDEAAALPLAGLTAYRALVTRGRLQRGETILITGVGGGVQSIVLLFAHALGARCIVTSGSDEKLVRARALGAEIAVNYREDPQWHKTIRSAGPIDLAIDSAGGETLARVLDLVRPGGRVVIYGGTTPQATIRPFSIFWKHLDVLGTSMGSPQDFREMLAFVERERLCPVVDRVYPLDDVAAALRRLQEGTQFGKVVVAIA
jgi:zinc-binding alcohol dehydrogenase/oxidoreductase